MIQQTWDYNPEGNKMDKVCRALLKDALISETVLDVLDVGNNPVFYPADIDLLLVKSDFNISTLEIKANGYGNGKGSLNNQSVFIEYISNDRKYLESGGKAGLGCARICKAEFFLFYFIKYDYYLLFKTKELQEFLENNIEKYPSKYAVTNDKNGQELYKSYGLIVPIEILRKEAGGVLIKSNCSYNKYEKEYLKQNSEKAS